MKLYEGDEIIEGFPEPPVTHILDDLPPVNRVHDPFFEAVMDYVCGLSDLMRYFRDTDYEKWREVMNDWVDIRDSMGWL